MLQRDEVNVDTVVRTNGYKLEGTLLTSGLIDTKSYSATRKLLGFSDTPEVEEIHGVAGDGCVMIKIG